MGFEILRKRQAGSAGQAISAIGGALGTSTGAGTTASASRTTAVGTALSSSTRVSTTSIASSATSVVSASPSPSAVAAASSSVNRTPIIVGVVVGVVVLVIIVAAVILRRARNARQRRSSQNGGFQKADKVDDEFYSKNVVVGDGGRGENYNQSSMNNNYQGGQRQNPEKDYSNNQQGNDGGNEQYERNRYLSGGLAGVGGNVGKNSRSNSPVEYRNMSPYPPKSSPSLSNSNNVYPPSSAPSSANLLQQDQAQSLPYDRQNRISPPALIIGGGNGKDESTSPFGVESPGQGKVYTVKRTFEPTLADELVIYPGDRVQLLISYDDGWALGINLDARPGATNSKGVFPFDCLEDSSASPPPPSKSGTTSPTNGQQISRVAAPSYPTQHHDSFPASVSSSSDPLTKSANQSPSTPTIQVSSYPGEESYREEQEARSRQRSPDDDRRAVQKKKRISSLIASRDADLYVAIGQQQRQRLPYQAQQQQSPMHGKEISYPIQLTTAQQQQQYRQQQQQQYR